MENEKQILYKLEEGWSARPLLNDDQIKELVKQTYGLNVTGKIKQVDSYDDRNFVLNGTLGVRNSDLDTEYRNDDKFVLKVFNSSNRDRLLLTHHNEVLLEASKHLPFHVPVPIATITMENVGVVDIPLSDNFVIREGSMEDLGGKRSLKHYTRLVTYIRGSEVMQTDYSSAFFKEIGNTIAKLDNVLKEVKVPLENLKREVWIWDVRCSLQLLPFYVEKIQDDIVKQMCRQSLELFKSQEHVIKTLPQQLIHNDLTATNMLQCDGKIVGVIDFDDMTLTYRACEIGIAASYIACLSEPDSRISAIRQTVQAYTDAVPLTAEELECLYVFVLARLAACIAKGEYTALKIDPNNEYLLYYSRKAIPCLEHFLKLGQDLFLEKILQ